MTIPTLPEPIAQGHGNSVRDIVEYSPGQVNDAWCRAILHTVLQSLELQYATALPHRAITPDTIVFRANGVPSLILDDRDAAPAPASQLADDLTALARVIHYAITEELAPAGPLVGRVDGYSAALLATVDACMDRDPARRPRSVDAVRGLLGTDILAPVAGAATLSGPAVAPDIEPDLDLDAGLDPDLDPDPTIVAGAGALPAAAFTSPSPEVPPSLPAVSPRPHLSSDATPAPVSVPAVTPAPAGRASPEPVAGTMLAGGSAAPDITVDAHRAGMGRGQRRAWMAGGGAIAIALAVVVFVTWPDAGPGNHVASTPPQTGTVAPAHLPAPGSAATTGAVAVDARTEPAADDEDVSPVSEAEVLAQSGVFMLFYERDDAPRPTSPSLNEELTRVETQAAQKDAVPASSDLEADAIDRAPLSPVVDAATASLTNPIEDAESAATPSSSSVSLMEAEDFSDSGAVSLTTQTSITSTTEDELEGSEQAEIGSHASKESTLPHQRTPPFMRTARLPSQSDHGPVNGSGFGQSGFRAVAAT